MGSDQRTYIKVHDGMFDHPKIDGLSDRAFRLLVESWCWCSRHLTDGAIKEATWLKRGTPSTRRELIDAGLAEVVPGGIQIHDYLEHQRSADEVAELREKRRASGMRGGKAKAKALASATASAKQTDSKTLAESESTYVLQTETELKASTSAAAVSAAAAFDQFWQAYPVKLGKKDARTAWDKAVRTTDPDVVIAGAERYRDDPNRDPAHTKWAQGWLNGQRWDDDPLPGRDTRSPSDQRAQHNASLIEYYAEQERKAIS